MLRTCWPRASSTLTSMGSSCGAGMAALSWIYDEWSTSLFVSARVTSGLPLPLCCGRVPLHCRLSAPLHCDASVTTRRASELCTGHPQHVRARQRSCSGGAIESGGLSVSAPVMARDCGRCGHVSRSHACGSPVHTHAHRLGEHTVSKSEANRADSACGGRSVVATKWRRDAVVHHGGGLAGEPPRARGR